MNDTKEAVEKNELMQRASRVMRSYVSRAEGWTESPRPGLREVRHNEFLAVVASQGPLTTADLYQIGGVQGWQRGSIRWEISECLWTAEIKEVGKRGKEVTYGRN